MMQSPCFRAPSVPALALLLFSLLSLPSAFAGRSLPLPLPAAATAADPIIPDNATCHLALSLEWLPPFCKEGPTGCLVTHLPANAKQLLRGKCASDFSKTPHCTVGPFRFAVGVKGIPPYGPSTCEKCSCHLQANPKNASNPKKEAVCDCDPLPPCYVSLAGATVAPGCPYGIQSRCVILKPNAGKKVAGKATHLGTCQAPEVTMCVSGGPTWGPFCYGVGAVNVPFPGNRCLACKCGEGGAIESCVAVPGCKQP